MVVDLLDHDRTPYSIGYGVRRFRGGSRQVSESLSYLDTPAQVLINLQQVPPRAGSSGTPRGWPGGNLRSCMHIPY
eukprot:SAG31_NODE_18157_length_645_cov_0.838828_1_plen_75_part_10